MPSAQEVSHISEKQPCNSTRKSLERLKDFKLHLDCKTTTIQTQADIPVEPKNIISKEFYYPLAVWKITK